MREKLHDFGFGHDFLDLLPKPQTTKDKDELDFFKTKLMCTKGIRQKICHPKWHVMFEDHAPDKGL